MGFEGSGSCPISRRKHGASARGNRRARYFLPMAIAPSFELAQQAMAGGRWDEARTHFESILAEGDDAEAFRGLGDVLWWLGDATGCLQCMEKAYSLHRDAANLVEAVTDCLWLAALQLKNFGNRAACSGWIATAERLIEQGGLDMLLGWVWWAQASVADAEVSRDYAERSVAVAREQGDRDLELCAVSELGRAYVALGRHEEGMQLIDEAMAAAMGEQARSLDTVVATCCSMMGACDLAADLTRVAQWCRAADQFMKTYGSPFLFADCRLRFGSVLFATGHWEEAERELRNAAEATSPDSDYYVQATARLATLRLRQGRFEEAEAMLADIRDLPAALLPAAELHFRRQEYQLALRNLSRIGEDIEPIELVQALHLIATCQLEAADADAAGRTVARMSELASRTFDRVQAHHLSAAGQLALALSEPEAEALLERSMKLFSGCNLPYETAQVRLALARALSASPDVALAEAQGAFTTFERLGASADADAAAVFVRSLGGPARTGPKDTGVLTKREQEVLRLIGAGLSNPEIAERLFLSRKTVSHHVSNILMKLGLRNRAQAAVQAGRFLS